jgi:hypothetical protein
MKKITAIFLLIVTVLASMHATMAFHYCGGSLRSVGFAGSEKVSCCEDENSREESYAGGNTIQGIPCCSNRYMKISTDDFSAAQNVITGNGGDSQPVAPVSCPVSEEESRVAALQHTFQFIFPPGGHVPSGIELLLSICILRL